MLSGSVIILGVVRPIEAGLCSCIMSEGAGVNVVNW